MRFNQTLQKNLKLLFRSKETAFTIIFGPLLIILLVGFAFSGSQDVDIALGVYSPEYTGLADSIIRDLQEDYVVNIWGSEEECTTKVAEGLNHLCITFPEDFRIEEGNRNEVKFHVDPSRINLVYQVIDKLGTRFAAQREELSLGLTGTILNNLDVTTTILEEQERNAEAIQGLQRNASSTLGDTRGRLGTGEINFTFIDLRQLRGQATSIEQDAQTLHQRGKEELDHAITTLNTLENDCDDCTNSTKEDIDEAITRFQEAQDELDRIYDESPDKLQTVYRMVDDAAGRIDSIEEDYGELKQDAAFVQERIAEATATLDEMRGRVTELKGNLGYAHDLLTGIAVADEESIVSPITTEIEEVTNETGNLAFTYPYILMLVIMFMGLMLGSTLIVSDKNSRAAFRNFTTATRDEFHVAMSFITTLLILLAQVLVILLFSYFLVATPLLNNFVTSMIIILLAITLFSFFGMMLGYLSSSQEAAMIASLSVGSVMLFVSNLVIPTEAMKAVVRAIAAANPYVVLSEMLKKSMLFDVGIGQFAAQLLLVFVLALVLLGGIIGVQQYVRKRYFRQQATLEAPKKRKAKPLQLGEKTVKDEYDLLTVLDLMTREEFAKHVNAKRNAIKSWASKELGNKKLARKLSTTNKEKMIIRLDKYLKKQTKRRKKK